MFMVKPVYVLSSQIYMLKLSDRNDITESRSFALHDFNPCSIPSTSYGHLSHPPRSKIRNNPSVLNVKPN